MFSGDEVDHVFTVPLKWFLEHEPECYDTDVQTIPGKDFPFDLIPGGEDYHWRRGRYKVMFLPVRGKCNLGDDGEDSPLVCGNVSEDFRA